MTVSFIDACFLSNKVYNSMGLKLTQLTTRDPENFGLLILEVADGSLLAVPRTLLGSG